MLSVGLLQLNPGSSEASEGGGFSRLSRWYDVGESSYPTELR